MNLLGVRHDRSTDTGDQTDHQSQDSVPGVVAEYDAARKALLAEEIEFRRHMTRLWASSAALCRRGL